MTGSEKTKARGQKWWSELRKGKIAQVKALDPKGKLRCQLTGTWIRKDSSAQCHHRFPDNYLSENLDDYRILSATSHDFVEWLGAMDRSHIPNREAMEAWLGEFLPVRVRETDKYYAMLENHEVKKF